MAAPVLAIEQAPSMPQVFYGTVYVGNDTVPASTFVEARGTGVHVNTEGNPVTTTAGGIYGGPGSYDPKLVVQGEITTGALIEFYVNGEKAECFDVKANSGWKASIAYQPAANTQLNLRVTVLPTVTWTTVATTVATTAPTSTATTTATPTSGSFVSGGGGGGGGGGGYIVSSVSGTPNLSGTTTITTTQTTGISNAVLERTEIITAAPTAPQETLPAVTATPSETPAAQNTTLPPMSQLVLYGAGALVIIAVIVLVAVGKYEGWWGRKPPEE